MRSFVLFALLSVACGSRLRAPVDTKLQPAEQEGCALTDAPKGTFNNALALVLPDEKDANKFLAEAEKSEDASKTPSKGEKKEWKAAMEEYVKTQTEMKKSQARLMSAMENMLQVPSVDTTKLNSMVDAKKKDTLVVFYAPWCPHCQTFVLHNGKGNPEEAPLEIFYKNIKAAKADKTLDVVRFDVAANREAGLEMPKGFEVQHIPTIYMASADGKKTVFSENHVDSQTLVDFIEKNSANTKKIGAIAPQTTV
jgi:thiol-disulfide isomerase/thioredoxin